MTILELAYQAGITPHKVSNTNGGEYHSACLACGGTDRFFIQPFKQMTKCLGSYCCRRCGIYGDSIQFAREFLNYSYQEAIALLGTVLNSFEQSYKRSNLTVLQAPAMRWIECATAFTENSHENILQNTEILNYLASRGLPLKAVQKYKFGWLNNDQYLIRAEWGLSDEIKEDGSTRKLWLPKGLVIPHVEKSGNVTRIKVRRFNCKSDDKLPKYAVISGSMNGLTVIGQSSKDVVIVESELDAYAADYAMNGEICAIAVGSNMKNPDVMTDHIAKEAQRILVCHDNDEAGRNMLKKWKKLYSQTKACPTPTGKDIGEAVQQGLNIRNWLLSEIKI